MTLVLHTANINRYEGPDAFDITRMTGGERGDPFAPSSRILGQAKAAQEQAAKLRAQAADLFAGTAQDRKRALDEAEDIDARAWRTYVPAFVDEMRDSLRNKERAWKALVSFSDRLVLCCYCENQMRCHRGLLVELLVRAGPRYRQKVTWAGEIGRRGDIISCSLPWERALVLCPDDVPPEYDGEAQRAFGVCKNDISLWMSRLHPTSIVVVAKASRGSLGHHAIEEADRLRLLREVRHERNGATINDRLAAGCARAAAWCYRGWDQMFWNQVDLVRNTTLVEYRHPPKLAHEAGA